MIIVSESIRIPCPRTINSIKITVEINNIPIEGIKEPKPVRVKRRNRNKVTIVPMKIGGANKIERSCCGPKTLPVRNPARNHGSSLKKNKSGFVVMKKNGDSEIIINGVNKSNSGNPVTPKNISPPI